LATEYATIQMRRGTAAQWSTANTVLADGEWGYETDTKKLKIGNGATAWNSLSYTIGGPALSPQLTLPTDLGYAAWNFDPSGTSGSLYSLLIGKIYLQRVDIRNNITVSKLAFGFNSGGSGMSNSYAGIYSSAGSRLAATTDISTAIQNVPGFELVVTLTASANLTANSFVWVALLVGASTGSAPQPTSASMPSNDIGQSQLTVQTARGGTYGTGQTSLPASITVASIAKNFSFLPWVAII